MFQELRLRCGRFEKTRARAPAPVAKKNMLPVLKKMLIAACSDSFPVISNESRKNVAA